MASTWPVVTVLTLPLAACGSPAPDRALPGPCNAHFDDVSVTYSYDAADLLVHVDYAGEVSTAWTRNPDGSVTRIRFSEDLDAYEWTFGDTDVVEDRDVGYDLYHHSPDLTFAGDPFDPDAILPPRSPDSIVRHEPYSSAAVDYTYEGPTQDGTRTRTGTDGSVETYTYDADGHLLSWEDSEGAVSTWTYEDGLVATFDGRYDHVTLTHDAYGNLVHEHNDQRGVDGHIYPRDTDFDYGCW